MRAKTTYEKEETDLQPVKLERKWVCSVLAGFLTDCYARENECVVL